MKSSYLFSRQSRDQDIGMGLSGRQEKSSSYLKGLIEFRGLPRNQLAALSGLSNTYIKHLENGQISNVSRQKIIALSIALNLDLDETDKLLNVFDRASLSGNDIPIFIEPGGKRKITSAMLPLQSSFTYELVNSLVEAAPGQIIIVAERPTANLFPEGYRSYLNRKKVNPHPMYFNLLEAVGRARHNNFINILKNYPVKLYMCEKCLGDYINNSADNEEKQWKKKHLELLIECIENHENFLVYLLDCCYGFNFTIKSPDPSVGGNEKLFFLGKAPHSYDLDSESVLTGFATENQVIVQNFKRGFQWIKHNTVSALHDREKMVSYLHDLIP